MTRLEGIKEAICIQYGIKDRKKIEGKLNMVAQDMLRRKEIQRQELRKGIKERFSKEYYTLTQKIFKGIEEIKDLI
ncbi:hypothetical protein [Fusobacterium necrophorum]|uniref:Uncharacterized protein n=3 Tax=Fusobacterium necrophorum TaxID=859 RepID=A0AAN4AUF4_9FUSO|nr:hypothetical protein [Fusobacterium necrophorum]AYV94671.1 hypothetical protein BWX37_03140 [Fusobacterium necrophorum subsp. funduliforme]EJU18816.1 hypothetical protein HMPREF1127_1108 [Fusobacterium necrophorum subsp. funduliforme Fnf 1007]KYL03319.1 hypothetical protein A2J06_09290 [Fusobacterium necrophorum subsp. funduliforme]KYM40887.1 hypothetical protein A2U03_03655 [Fusobacterium necrophorum subsp. funduliforme]KYM44075.1 hypothetical protein A2U15_07195 [Fusobacterium necrophorum